MSRSEAVVSKQVQQGFSLMELMVVVAIVAILAAVAIPSYRDHVLKTHRAAAESFMSQAANKEEQILLDMRNYAPVTANANFVNAPASPSTATSGISLAVPDHVAQDYDLTITTTTSTTSPPTFKITAAPKGPQQVGDTLCGTLTLDSTGLKGIVGGTGSAAVCW